MEKGLVQQKGASGYPTIPRTSVDLQAIANLQVVDRRLVRSSRGWNSSLWKVLREQESKNRLFAFEIQRGWH